MNRGLIFAIAVLCLAGCRRKEQCPIITPSLRLVGFQASDLDTVLICRTAFDNYNKVIDSVYLYGNDTLNTGGSDTLGLSMPDRYFLLDQQYARKLVVPATHSTFLYKAISVKYNESGSQSSCASTVEEVEVNGVVTPRNSVVGVHTIYFVR